MCVLVYCEKRKITEDEFKNCFNKNPDGFGMAWREKTGIYFKKGLMTVNDAWDFYNNHKFNNGHVLHFRKKSIGVIVPELTHPFIVTEKNENPLEGVFNIDKDRHGLLFQNGTIREWDSFFFTYMIASKNISINHEELSDTRALAIIIARTGHELLTHLDSKFIFYNDKYAYFYGKFEEVNGVQFSNDSYKPPVTVPAITYPRYDCEYSRYGKSNRWKNWEDKPKSTIKEEFPWNNVANYKF